MKYLILLFLCIVSFFGYSQKKSLSLGVNSDVLLESPSYDFYYGFQGKYGLKEHSYILGNIGYSTANITFIGADYSYDIYRFNNLIKAYTNAGIGAEFYSKKMGESIGRSKDTYLPMNVQIGFELNVKNSIQVYAGYKAKYYIDQDVLDPNYLNFGLRYKLR